MHTQSIMCLFVLLQETITKRKTKRGYKMCRNQSHKSRKQSHKSRKQSHKSRNQTKKCHRSESDTKVGNRHKKSEIDTKLKKKSESVILSVERDTHSLLSLIYMYHTSPPVDVATASSFFSSSLFIPFSMKSSLTTLSLL